MEVHSRLSDKSTSSPDQNADNSDTNEVEMITKTQPECLEGVPRLRREVAFRQTEIGAKRKNVMFTPKEDKFLKAGLKKHGFGHWEAILRDPEFHFEKGRTANSLLSRAARRFGPRSKSTHRV